MVGAAARPPLMAAPRLLVVSTQPWNLAARLAGALGEAGCHVEAASPPGALLARSAAPLAWHRLRQWRLAADLAATLRRTLPDRVVPCDDCSAALLAGLHADPALAAIVEASLGDPAGYPVARRKSAQMALAASLGLPMPPTRPVADLASLNAALAEAPLPLVLKTDGSWGGTGVIVLGAADDAAAAMARATRRPGLGHTAKLAAWERSIRPFIARRQWQPGIPDLQAFIAGRPANRAVLCTRGEVLAGLSVEVLETISPNGPASVVRVIDHPQMTASAAAMAARLGLSGFLGFDFIVREGSGEALLLEMNPRATPICHLATTSGGGLAGVLAASLRGEAAGAAGLPAPGQTIALFPSEWLRDPASRWLHEAWHDVPWQDIRLIRAYLDDAEADLRFARWRARWRRWRGR